jgi:hypothetical protein
VDRVEEVQPADPLRVAQPLLHLLDQQRRGVGRQDRPRPAALLQLAEDLALQVQVLDHRFHHQLHVAEAFPGRRAAHGGPLAPGFFRREQLALHGLGEEVVDLLQPGGQGGVVDLLHGHRAALERGQLGDAGPHRAGADDADLADGGARAALLGLLLEEEQADQVVAGRRRGQAADRLALVGQAGGHALGEADFHGPQRLGRGGHVVGHLLA